MHCGSGASGKKSRITGQDGQDDGKKAAGGGNQTPTTTSVFFGSSYPKMYLLSSGVHLILGANMFLCFPPKPQKGVFSTKGRVPTYNQNYIP